MSYDDWNKPRPEFSSLVGKTLTSFRARAGDETVEMITTTGEIYILKHYQDCCENVYLGDIVGDPMDMVGSEILMAEVVSEDTQYPAHEFSECGTFTFYKMRTAKGNFDMRWIGESNGYYSERVDFVRLI